MVTNQEFRNIEDKRKLSKGLFKNGATLTTGYNPGKYNCVGQGVFFQSGTKGKR